MDQVKVLVILGESSEMNRTSEVVDENGTKKYYGFNWDIWEKVRDRLKDRYTFVVSFTAKTDEDYDALIEKVAEGKFDLVVGTFFRTPWRESKVEFVAPHSIDSNIILHKKENNMFNDLYQVVVHIGWLIVYLVLTGVVFGLALFLIDPHRRDILRSKNRSKSRFFFRSLLTGVATVFGEMGFLSENASLGKGGMLLVVIIMVISVVLIMFTQAKITQIMIDIQTKLNRSNIRGKNFLSFKGYSVAEKMRKYKVNITLKDSITTDELVKEYLDNDKKYSGCLLARSHALLYNKIYDNLTISDNFGNEPAGWVINNRRNELRKDINTVILDMINDNDLARICNDYYNQNGILCSLL